MTVQSVLLPVFVHVLLVFGILGGLIVTGSQGSARAVQFSAHLRNQFEMPVLFLVLVVVAMIVHRTDTLFVVLEWLFVLARLLHAGIHVTSNRQPWRGAVFAVSSLILLVGWIKLALEVLTAA